MTNKNVCAIIPSTVDKIKGNMASMKQFIERRDNIAYIVTYLRRVGKVTRIEISSAISLSGACVSDFYRIK